MENARTLKNFQIALAIFCLTAALFLPSKVRAAAGGIQDCVAGSTCVIGEFLYDDSSAPINDATCSAVSWYPDDTSFPDATTTLDLPTQSDGWYSVSFTAPPTLGFYRTTISCTVLGDTLSIDKSFQVNEAAATDPSAVASAVWSFNGKTLDSFGTLPQEIWNYSTRTVSSFGNLIGNIWSNATRTLTGASLDSGNLATQDDVTSVRNLVNSTSTTNTTTATGDLAGIKKTVDENRLLLEQIVNKPIIENVLEETVPPIGEKLNNTRAQANQLYINNQYLTSQTAVLAANWNSMNGKEVLDAVIAISGVLGESGDASDANTMFAQANWIKDSWNWDEAGATSTQLASAQKLVSNLKMGLADYQKSPALLSEVEQLVKISLGLEKIIGTTSDGADKGTLFAKIASTQALALKLDDKSLQIGKVLGSYTKSGDFASISTQLTDLQNQIIALNRIPGGVTAITRVNPTDSKSVVNSLLSLKGIVDSNKKLLALGSGQTMVNIWLEVGSIVFKTIVTNPSNLISQKVDVKYYLPKEIKQEDIVKTDAGLSVNYDTDKDQLYVSGTFDLAKGQTRTFSVETKDIWQVTTAEIQSIRDQADQLSKPLEKTSFYAQGVTLKSDIDAAMDQIEVLNSGVITPEDKIQVYRQAMILMGSANTNLVAMKDLVTQASAAGSMFGFVGGAQTIAVWGIILVVAAGFVFMTIYMKVVIKKEKSVASAENPSSLLVPEVKPTNRGGSTRFRFAAMIVAASIVSAGASGIFVSKIMTKNFEQKVQVLGTSSGQIVRATPAPQINDAAVEQGSQEFSGTGGAYLVTISDTPTGFLNVMEEPGGVVIGNA
jgi:hypothetical protein